MPLNRKRSVVASNSFHFVHSPISGHLSLLVIPLSLAKLSSCGSGSVNSSSMVVFVDMVDLEFDLDLDLDLDVEFDLDFDWDRDLN